MSSSAWHGLYLVAEVLSCVSTLAIVIKLLSQRDQKVQNSAVFWTLVFFFCWLAVWTLARAILLVWMLRHDHQSHADPALWYHDAMELGGGGGGSSSNAAVAAYDVTQWQLIVLIIVGDVAIVGTSLWLLVMARELYILAKHTMDRGETREKWMIQRYGVAVTSLMLLFALIEVILTLVHQKYNPNFVFSACTAFSIQLIGLVSVAFAVCSLRRKGRNVEHVHGHFVKSPLYVRIRNLLLVFAVFSLQYQVLVLLFRRLRNGDTPPKVSHWVVGLSSTLYRLVGLLLSFVMGCSQEWIVRLCGKCMPQEYVDSVMADAVVSSTSDANAGFVPEPPRVNPVFVFTDIESSSALWAIREGELMRPANELHDDILRSLLLQHRGYEITTAGDAFQLVFTSIQDAVEYCMHVQMQLLTAKWPKKLRSCGLDSVKREKIAGRVVFDGVRVRMGIHDANAEVEGKLIFSIHPVTRKATYTGLSEVVASKISDLGHGGQIVMTARVAAWVQCNHTLLQPKCHISKLGDYHLTSVDLPVEVFSLVMEGLEARGEMFKRAPPRRVESCLPVVLDYAECQSDEE